jgi:hypothetical protein
MEVLEEDAADRKSKLAKLFGVYPCATRSPAEIQLAAAQVRTSASPAIRRRRLPAPGPRRQLQSTQADDTAAFYYVAEGATGCGATGSSESAWVQDGCGRHRWPSKCEPWNVPMM